MTPSRSTRPHGIAAGLFFLILALQGCKEPTPALPPPDQTYTVRGQIVELPDAQKPQSEFRIQHERIPEFVGRDGKVVGMAPMAMGFTPAKTLPLEGIEVGDKVEFTFEVRWKSRPASLITRLTELPPETELNFSR